MKVKDTDGNVKICSTCSREMHDNLCTTHKISNDPCYYCHLQAHHMVKWGDDKSGGKEIPVNPSEGGQV